jgi:hypothetical protein
LLAERENEAGKSGLFLFEKCMIKTLFPDLPFADDMVATEISADANPLTCLGPHLFRTIPSILAVLQSLGPLF